MTQKRRPPQASGPLRCWVLIYLSLKREVRVSQTGVLVHPTQVRRAFPPCASTASSALRGLGLIALGRHEALGAGIIQVSDQKQGGCPFPIPQKERGRLRQARSWAVATDHFATGLTLTAT